MTDLDTGLETEGKIIETNIKFQKILSEKISLKNLKNKISIITGADVAYLKNSNTAYAGVIVMSFPDLCLKE